VSLGVGESFAFVSNFAGQGCGGRGCRGRGGGRGRDGSHP